MSRSSREEVSTTTGIDLGTRVGLDAPEHLHAVDQRQLQVQQDHLGTILDLAVGVRAGAEDELQGLRPVAHDMDVIGEVVLLERMECQFHVVGIVLDEQDLDLSSVMDSPPPRVK